jgi:hypothetical protein
MRLDEAGRAPFADALDQLGDELRWLDRLLVRHVSALRAQDRFNEDPMRGLYISEEEALAALAAAPAEPGGEWLAGVGRATLDARASRGAELPLARIARRFGLDAFERTVLLIAAAPALDRRYQILYAYAQNDVGRRLPTIDFAISLLIDEDSSRFRHLSRFAPAAPLVRGGIVHVLEPERAKPLSDRALSIDDRVVMALLGAAPDPDARLAPFVRRFAAPADREPDPRLLRECAAAFGAAPCFVLFEGPLDAGQADAALAACRAQGEGLIAADLDHPAARAAPPEELGRLLAREALLADSGLIVSASHAWPDLGLERAIVAAAALKPRLFATVRHGALSLPPIARAVRTACVRVDRPDALARARWWRGALPAAQLPSAERLAQRTRIGPIAIDAMLAAAPGGGEAELMAAAQLYAGGRLPAFAERIAAPWSWEDLVLPARQREQLRELAATLVHWPQVMGEWRFAEALVSPQNCIALFSGPSGTGKSMAASLVARKAGMPLYRVDLSAIFDKYIGETEKQLDRLFDAAADAGAVLLFDEADALFGKRTALKDAHDRYANLSVAFLLQRIESYDGLAILASNLPGNMDEAFARRLSHVVAFPLPDEGLRRALWRRAFPEAAPLAADLDLDTVAASFELSGGNIRNAALAAAYLAATDASAIGRRHVVAAVGRELEKVGRSPIAADYGALAPGG